VHYDDRSRETALERSPQLALQRIHLLRRQLSAWPQQDLLQEVQVHTLGGMLGEWRLVTRSTLARELVFLNSHAVHHFALLKPACIALGKRISQFFGKAPATVAHERKPVASKHFS
jgi:hypothetical protein